MKICICTIGKLENLYIREFISHYRSYGVDKIYIYDNNDINGENFETVINDYIKSEYVQIINFRGKIKQQLKAYQDCLNTNYDKYSWLIFYDIDEFIYLKDFKNIKEYLSQHKFKKCQTVQLNMYFHNDNNLLYYDNRTLFERFTKKIKKPKEAVKSILKGNIKINVDCVHNINKCLQSCNALGEFNKKEKKNIITIFPDFNNYYIDHFCFKSTEEFINKLIRGSAVYGKINNIKLTKIGWYFDKNNITSAKIDLIEKSLRINLSEYRNKIQWGT